MIKGRPPRLDFVYVESPLFFVTFATSDRRIFPSLEKTKDAFDHYATRAGSFNIAVGRYVIMPNHVHLFVGGDQNFVLSPWVGGLKRAISTALSAGGRLWQPGFFDHVLRSDESYAQKWKYVRENPRRAGLVKDPDEWPYQGEIVLIDRA